VSPLALLLIFLSVILGVGRNVLSKTISGISPKIKTFYFLQGVIFISGAAILSCYPETFVSLSSKTAVLALIYGLLLVTAQWNLTLALAEGNTGVCVTVYAMGFVLPTLSGMLFWDERVSVLRICGITLAALAVLTSGNSDTKKGKSKKYLIPLGLAMSASGGLGIMQKIQQNTPYGHEKTTFVFLAFLVAAALSFLRIGLCKGSKIKVLKIQIISAVFAGICFSACNLFNTILAGMFESAVVFPLLNISSIFASMAFCTIFFREKITFKNLLVLCLGTGAILLIGIG